MLEVCWRTQELYLKTWEPDHSCEGSRGAFVSLLHHCPAMQFRSSFSSSGFSLATLALFADKLEKR